MTATLALAFALAAGGTAADGACAVRSGRPAVPLVELYTSEGCNSCPPADRWFSQRVAEGGANALAFHVDYWDQLGWPDRFAAKAHTRRQRERVWARSSPTVYTPQVMVGTNIHAPWRDAKAFAAVLAKRAPARAGLALRVVRGQAVVAAAPLAGAAPESAKLWLARYADDRTTRVPAGENRGATLHHDRVVQGLWGPWPLTAPVTVRRIDLGAAPAPRWGLVAFVQDPRGDTLQSLALAMPQCASP